MHVTAIDNNTFPRFPIILLFSRDLYLEQRARKLEIDKIISLRYTMIKKKQCKTE